MLLRDLAYAVRQLRRAPVFAAGVVLSLGFGIGASATVYSWIQSMLLRPLPGVRDAGRLVTVRPELRNGFGISVDEYREWRDQAGSYQGLAASSFGLFAIETGPAGPGGRQPIYGIFASGNYFGVLGVRPAGGRLLSDADDIEGAPPVAVLGHSAWHRLFAADPSVVGRIVRINGRSVRIVGIAAPRFGGTLSVARFDLWVPLHLRPYLIPAEAEIWKRRDFRWLDATGRLAPGIEREQAHQEIQRIALGQAERYEENRGRGARVTPLDIGTVARLEPQLVAMAAVTLLVVLLICSNVANLLLTRATAREREMAMRLALGAARRRLLGQLMVESSLLAVLGAGLGVVMAAFGDSFIILMMPPTSVTFEVHSSLDFRFLGFVVAVTVGCVLAFGLPPAVLASRTPPAETLKSGGGGGGTRGGGLRASLVAAQFALALAILAGAAVFYRRDAAVHRLDLGYRGGDQVLLVQTEMSLAGYADLPRWGRAVEEAASRIAAEPGVRAVALGSFVPLSITGYSRRPVAIPGAEQEPGTLDRVLLNGVSDGYFALMGIPLLEGRGFGSQDTPDQPLVVVVNQGFAEKYYAGGSPLGQRFAMGGDEVTIVGVARNGRYDYREIDNAGLPLVYFAWHQSPSPFVTLHVRGDGDPFRLVTPVRRVMQAVDPAFALLPPTTLRETAGVPFAVSRSSLSILSILGFAALLLASMGLFSVVTYSVSLRTRELGIRMALGASGRGIMGLVLRGAAGMVLAGTAAGVLASLLLTGGLRARMTFLPDAEVAEYLVPAMILGAAALVAGLLPARRATRLDPMQTLRSD